MISREQVADLQPGDVVELTWTDNPDSKVTGKVWQDQDECLRHGVTVIRRRDGDPWMGARRELTVVSRAPRLYVNSDRTEPVHGDIVRDGDGDAWQFIGRNWLLRGGSQSGCSSIDDCRPLTLLWDGTTGQAVTS